MKNFLLALLVLPNVCSSQTWKNLGPIGSPQASSGHSHGTGQIHSISLDPTNNNVIYAGSPFGGLWRTADGGLTWSVRRQHKVDFWGHYLMWSSSSSLIEFFGGIATKIVV